MTTKHTPRPWHYAECQMGTPFVDTESVGDLLAAALPLDEEKANAHLIAAAPDLLAACETALSIMEQANKVNVPPMARFIEITFAAEDVAAIRAAIAKAKGKTK